MAFISDYSKDSASVCFRATAENWPEGVVSQCRFSGFPAHLTFLRSGCKFFFVLCYCASHA